MNILLSALINHFLSVAEQELIKDEPEIVQAIENELKLLISKIENLLSTKSPSVAAIVNPVLTSAETVADSALSAAGKAAVGIQTPQSTN
jgi:hypothetical protein